MSGRKPVKDIATINKEIKPWLDVRTRLENSAQAQRLAGLLRKAGAVRVMAQQLELWSLWPDQELGQEALARLAQEEPGVRWRWRVAEAADPARVWQRPFPEEVGQGLCLAPAWTGCPAGPQTLVIDALIAFGGGDHPSTRLNLNLICQVCQGEIPAGGWLADVGSGTGVLALALALKTGRRVVAVDPDPAAGRAMARNQALNPLAGPLTHFVRATHAVLAGPLALAAANLPEPILRMAAGHLAERLMPGAWLLASGFRSEAEAGLAGYLAGLGLHRRLSEESEGWSGLALQKEPA